MGFKLRGVGRTGDEQIGDEGRIDKKPPSAVSTGQCYPKNTVPNPVLTDQSVGPGSDRPPLRDSPDKDLPCSLTQAPQVIPQSKRNAIVNPNGFENTVPK